MKGRVGVLVALLSLAACRGSEPAEEPKSAEAPASEVTLSADQITRGGVKWSAASVATLTETIELPGELKVDENRTARVSAPASGRVLTIGLNAGDQVSRDATVAVLQSEEAGAIRADLAKATAEIGNRQSALEFARQARERAERLLALKAVAQQDVERARTDERAAQAALTQAQADVDRARTALVTHDVDPDTGRVLLKAPLDGLVLSRDAMAGAVVDAGATIVVITDPTALWLTVAVPDRLSTSIKAGTRMQFSVSAIPGTTFNATVRNMAASVDPATRTVLVRADVANPQRRLKPEMLATVRLETSSAQKGIGIPDDAVQTVGDRPIVFVAEPDGKGGARFKPRDVELVALSEGRRLVRGVNEGELVVMQGAFTVKAAFGRSRIRIE